MIMNIYEGNGKNIFIGWKMKFSIHIQTPNHIEVFFKKILN